MKKIKSLMLMMLMIFVGGMICSCGNDDDDNVDGNRGGAISTYTLHCTISDYGTMHEEYAAFLKQGLDAYAARSFPNASLETVKAALDEAVDEAVKSGNYNDSPYNYTIEFYITDSNGKKVYSRFIVVKDGTAMAK